MLPCWPVQSKPGMALNQCGMNIQGKHAAHASANQNISWKVDTQKYPGKSNHTGPDQQGCRNRTKAQQAADREHKCCRCMARGKTEFVSSDNLAFKPRDCLRRASSAAGILENIINGTLNGKAQTKQQRECLITTKIHQERCDCGQSVELSICRSGNAATVLGQPRLMMLHTAKQAQVHCLYSVQ